MPEPKNASPFAQLEEYLYHPDPRVEIYCEALAVGMKPKEASHHSEISQRTVREWKQHAKTFQAQDDFQDWRVKASAAIRRAIVHARIDMLKIIRKAAPDDWRAGQAVLKHIDEHELFSARTQAYKAARDLDRAREKNLHIANSFMEEKLEQLKLMCRKLGIEIENLDTSSISGVKETFGNALSLIVQGNPIMSPQEKEDALKQIQAIG